MIGGVEESIPESAPEVDVDPGTRRELVNRMMRRQIALSLRVAAVFIVLLVALPLFNLFDPALAHQEVAGFSLTWLILGIVFFPITWALSGYFVHASEGVEAKLVAENREHVIKGSSA
jgi:uncharacterized membrane protein (DUF485 family)